MSFTSPPLGLELQPVFAVYDDQHYPSEWTAGTTITCVPNEPFVPYPLDLSASSVVDFTADPGDITFFGFSDLSFAPFYALTVRFSQPDEFGAWQEPQLCKLAPPFDDYVAEGPHLDAVIDATLVDGTGASTAASGSFGGEPWIIEGLLVNPSPPGPVPDFEGNEYWRVLFTADQFVAISASLAVESGPGIIDTNPGVLSVTAFPYRWLPGGRSANLMCVL